MVRVCVELMTNQVPNGLLDQLISSYLYLVCHALDLRAMQKQYNASLQGLLVEELTTHLGRHFDNGIIPSALQSQLVSVVLGGLGPASTTDAERQLEIVASGMTSPILDFFASSSNMLQEHMIIHSLSALRSSFARRGADMLQASRHAFIAGKSHFPFALGYSPNVPAAPFIGRTRPVYEFIREGLGIRMHGSDNLGKFSGPLGGEPSIGYNVSLIYEVSIVLATSLNSEAEFT
jgi:phenylalanine ammonia-lyase